jgi:hypothetical protein
MSRTPFLVGVGLRVVPMLAALSLLASPPVWSVMKASALSTGDRDATRLEMARQPALGTPLAACHGGNPVVLVLVEPALGPSITAAVSRFVKDLCDDGYAAMAASPDLQTPLDVRILLSDVYSASGQQLVGAILVGEFPHAYQFVQAVSLNPSIPTTSEEVISYQFYSDLDGTFAASPGYSSPGGHPFSYDVHTGAVDWEIWIGVLPRYKGDLSSTETALKQYFKKNRAFRRGTHPYPLPRRFLLVSEHLSAATIAQHNQLMTDFQTGQYAWTPWSSAFNALIYFTSPTAGLTVQQGYAALSSRAADVFVGEAHGTWAAHGQLDIDWAETNSIDTTLFWSDGCAVGNLDHPDNFLTSVLYSSTSLVVAAKGTTNNSGGIGTNSEGFFGHNVASRMAIGYALGDALIGHVNVPLIWPWSLGREFHLATVLLLGDPTISLLDTRRH